MPNEDQEFIKSFGLLGSDVSGSAEIPAPDDHSDLLNEFGLAPQAKPEPTAMVGEFQGEAPWGDWTDLANNVLIGQGPRLAGAVEAWKQALREGSFEHMPETYDYAKTQLENRSEAYRKAYPGKSLANALVGQAPVTLGMMGLGQEYAVAPIAARIGAAMPKLGAAVKGAVAGNSGIENALIRTGVNTVQGVGQGAVGGAITSLAQNDPEVLKNMGVGAIVGAVLNPVLGATIPRVAQYLKSVVSPDIASRADVLLKNGIDVKPSQLSPELQRVSNKLGIEGDESQLEQLGLAVNKMVGVNSKTFTTDTLNQAKDNVGRGFDQFAQSIRTNMGDQTLLNNLNNVRNDLNAARRTLAPTDYNKVMQYINNVQRDVLDGKLTGAQFRKYTKFDSAFGSLAHSGNSDVAAYGKRIVNELHDTLGRRFPANASELNELKKKWSLILDLEPVAAKSEKTGGLIDPLALQTVKLLNRKDGDIFRASSLLNDIRPTAQGGVVKKGSNAASTLTRLMGEIKSSGLSGGAAYLIPSILGNEPGTLAAAGMAAAGGAGARFLRDQYLKSLLQRPSVRNHLLSGPLGRPTPAVPWDVLGLQGTRALAVPSAAKLYNNRGQE